MCCGETGASSPEYQKRFKPENNSGCCCGGGPDSCDLPSKARSGSALWEWEQQYGKIVNQVTEELGPDGKFHLVHTKTVCEQPVRKRSRGCCSLSYKIIR